MPDSTEPISDDQLTIDDILNPEAMTYHPILQVWKEILAGSAQARKERVSPQAAVRLVGRYHDFSFSDIPDYLDLFYMRIDQMADLLSAEVEDDPEYTSYTSPEEDRENNATHYLNVIFGWQKLLLGWELDWDVLDHEAAIQLAVMAEVHQMFFGDTGLITLLEQIGFDFNDTHQEQLREELNALRAEWAPVETDTDE